MSLFFGLIPRVLAALEPWAGVSERLRRSGLGLAKVPGGGSRTLSAFSLFISQRDERIDAGGAAGGNTGREHGDEEEECRDRYVCQRIARRDVEEQAAN